MENPIVKFDPDGSQPVLRQADSDEMLIGLWLHGRGKGTTTVYDADSRQFLNFVGKPLHQITLGDIQAYADELERQGLRPATRNRKLSVVKSLFAFAHRLGYLQFDVSRPVRVPGVKDCLAERILSEEEVVRMIALEVQPRNHLILMTFYAVALRVSELCGLRWRDLQCRDSGGQVTVFGKGEKTRTVLMPQSVWNKLIALRGEAGENDPVFRSRKKGHLTPVQVRRIVLRAAQRAGIKKAVSCHWLRHAHASHALDHSCPIHLLAFNLGHSSIQTTGRYAHAKPLDSSSNYLKL